MKDNEQELIFLNPENATSEEAESYEKRGTARGIVVDADGKIALLSVTKNNYYKLPGGGIDEGETIEEAYKRECLEEVGCEVEVTGMLGTIKEWRKLAKLNQTSYCFTSRVVGEKGQTNFTESEKQNGFEVVWLEKEDAYEKLQATVPQNYEGLAYIKARDLAIIEAYLKI